MNNDEKARLLTILMFAYDGMNKDVGSYKSELQTTAKQLVDVMSSIGEMLGVDINSAIYALLNEFSSVDSFHDNPSEEMLTSENYKMIDTLIKTSINLATDLKNEIEKVEK